MKQKIFCVGFHKTGTTSLGSALEILGYRVCGVQKELLLPIVSGDFSPVLEKVKHFDAFKDNPWPVIYRQLDQHFPDSRFILTVRSENEWLLSINNHFGKRTTKMREWIYGEGCGDPLGNAEIYLARYIRHNEEVISWFSDRNQKLLVMDITAGDGWQKLCTFLRIQTPAEPFPFRNKRRVNSYG